MSADTIQKPIDESQSIVGKYPCDLVFEGKDQNETWLFSTSMISSLLINILYF